MVAIAASGGKDSTVLGYVMKLLNERFDYGLKLVLLSIDEGIPGLILTELLLNSYLSSTSYRLQRRQFGNS